MKQSAIRPANNIAESLPKSHNLQKALVLYMCHETPGNA